MFFHLWGNDRNVWIWRLECTSAKTNMLLAIRIVKMFHCSGSSKIRINKTIECHLLFSFSIYVYNIFFLLLLVGEIEFIISSEGKSKEWLYLILDISYNHSFHAKIQTEPNKRKPLNLDGLWSVKPTNRSSSLALNWGSESSAVQSIRIKSNLLWKHAAVRVWECQF